MNQDILKGQWRQMRGEARKNFGKLTDDDMDVIGGNLDKFVGKIQETYGYTKDEASRQLRNFADNFRSQYPETWDSWYNQPVDSTGRVVTDKVNQSNVR
jgi:uncharacterized protein YjbJ (UPF0337 family)